MDPLCLCYKVTNLLFLINPFTLQRAELNVEKFNNAPFRALLTPQSLVEYTVLGVSFNPHHAQQEAGDKRRFRLEEVTVCRTAPCSARATPFSGTISPAPSSTTTTSSPWG